MIYKIQKGDKFKYIKTFKMNTGEKAYIKGKYYFSALANCITDDYESDISDFFEHFKLIYE